MKAMQGAKRLTGMLLAALLLAGGLAVAASAATPEQALAKASYIKIGSKKYSAKKDFKAGKASWSKKSQTLTLKGAKGVRSIGVSGSGTVKVKISGSCTMKNNASIRGGSSLKFTGTGSLTLTGKSCGIKASSNLAFAGPKITVKSPGGHGVRAANIAVTKGKVTVCYPGKGRYGFYARGAKAQPGTFKVTGGSAIVTGKSYSGGIEADNVKVTGGTLKVTGGGDIAAESYIYNGKRYGGYLTITGGSVSVSRGLYGERGSVKCSYLNANIDSKRSDYPCTISYAHAFKWSGVTGTCSVCKEKKKYPEDYSWAELKSIANEIAACSSEAEAIAKAKSHHLVGSDGKLTGDETKTLTLSNGTECVVWILGFWHDDKTSGGKAGITFGFRDTVENHSANSSDTNLGGWESSDMRTYLNGAFFNGLPSDVRDNIVSVSKKTNNLGQAENADAVTATSDKVWLLSIVECLGDSWVSEVRDWWDYEPDGCFSDLYTAEGLQYKLYADKGAITSNTSFLEKHPVGSSLADYWWVRSSDAVSDEFFRGIGEEGNYGYVFDAGGSYGVSPAFCF